MHPVQLFELVFIMLLAILVLHWIALRLNCRRQWRCWSAEARWPSFLDCRS